VKYGIVKAKSTLNKVSQVRKVPWIKNILFKISATGEAWTQSEQNVPKTKGYRDFKPRRVGS
jgi:hypothetical protein